VKFNIIDDSSHSLHDCSSVKPMAEQTVFGIRGTHHRKNGSRSLIPIGKQMKCIPLLAQNPILSESFIVQFYSLIPVPRHIKRGERRSTPSSFASQWTKSSLPGRALPNRQDKYSLVPPRYYPSLQPKFAHPRAVFVTLVVGRDARIPGLRISSNRYEMLCTPFQA
jgi:hypothetical protein